MAYYSDNITAISSQRMACIKVGIHRGNVTKSIRGIARRVNWAYGIPNAEPISTKSIRAKNVRAGYISACSIKNVWFCTITFC